MYVDPFINLTLTKKKLHHYSIQCFGSVSLAQIRIRIRKHWSGSRYQKKIVINSHTNQPKLWKYNFFFRNHLFCLVYANNKLKITTTKKHSTEKLRRKKLEFVRFKVGSGSRTGSGSGSIIPEMDPRFRIRIKMKRIQNTDSISWNPTHPAFF